MNILIISPYLPYPLSSGGAQAVFNMIDNLRHQHKFTMVINEGGQNNAENRKALQKIWPDVDLVYYSFKNQLLSTSFIYEKTRRVLFRKFMPSSRHFMIETVLRPYGEWFSGHHVSFMKSIIKKKNIDLVQVEFMESLQWVYHLPAGIKKIFIHHELGFVRKERLLSNFTLSDKEKNMLAEAKKTELEALKMYDAVVTVTDVDKHILMNEGANSNIYVSNLAVNTKPHPYSRRHGELTFVGGYGHMPNKEGIDWFLSEVAPRLSNNKFKLNLIGTRWPKEYTSNKDIDVLSKGFVQELSDFALGTIMIVPILSGSGMRMKILEAAAMSLPIVTTTVGVEGLDFANGESCIIADTPADFAKAIIRLENDDNLRCSLGTKANQVFFEKYSPKVLADKRNNIYKQLMKKKQE